MLYLPHVQQLRRKVDIGPGPSALKNQVLKTPSLLPKTPHGRRDQDVLSLAPGPLECQSLS